MLHGDTMEEAHHTVAGTLLGTFPLTTSVAVLIIFVVLFHRLRYANQPTVIGALWLWPLYLWGLESVLGIFSLFGWGNMNDPELLRAWKRLIFVSLYCGAGLIPVEWLILRLAYGAEGPIRLKRGSEAWCHAFVIGDVLLILVFCFVVGYSRWEVH